MKKTFVRILAFLLVLCMFFSMIACGAKDQPEDTPAAPSEEVSANPPAQPESGSEEREHVELIFYTHANAIFAGFDKTMAAVNEYLKEKLNTTVDFRIYEQSTYKDTVNPAFMSGDEMDCLLVGSTGIDFVTNVSKNAFIDISSYIDTYLPGTKARLPEAAWDAYSYQGGIYGICSIKDLANQLGIYTNDTLLNDLGIEFPADTYYTWKDLVPFFYEVQAARDAKYPEKAGKPMLAANEAGQCIFYDFYDFLVGSYSTPLVITGIPGLQDYEGVKSGEEVTSYFYTDEFREYCEIIKGFRDNGLIQFEFNPDEYTSLYDGDAIGGIVWGDLAVDAAQRGYPFETTMHYANASTLMTSGMLAAGFALPVQCSNVERTLEVIELLNTDQYLATLMHFGPEGIGWTDADNDGVLEFEGTENDPSIEWLEKCWYQWYGFGLGAMTASKAPEGYPADFADRVFEMNKNGKDSGNLGFTFDATNVQTELAACNAVMDEYMSTFNYGTASDLDATIDEFVNKLKANGLDTIIAECQTQLTEWRAANGK